jgi:hypothetical protein
LRSSNPETKLGKLLPFEFHCGELKVARGRLCCLKPDGRGQVIPSHHHHILERAQVPRKRLSNVFNPRRNVNAVVGRVSRKNNLRQLCSRPLKRFARRIVNKRSLTRPECLARCSRPPPDLPNSALEFLKQSSRDCTCGVCNGELRSLGQHGLPFVRELYSSSCKPAPILVNLPDPPWAPRHPPGRHLWCKLLFIRKLKTASWNRRCGNCPILPVAGNRRWQGIPAMRADAAGTHRPGARLQSRAVHL